MRWLVLVLAPFLSAAASDVCPDTAQGWIPLESVAGYYVIAFHQDSATVHLNRETRVELEVRPHTLREVEAQIIERVGLANPGRYNRLERLARRQSAGRTVFAFFQVDVLPRRMHSEDACEGLVLAFEGGQFMWPGIEVGHTREIPVGNQTVALTTESMEPLVLSLSAAVDLAVCEEWVRVARGRLSDPEVIDPEEGVGRSDDEWRTGGVYFMPSIEQDATSFAHWVAEATVTHVRQQEGVDVQILRYLPGQRFSAHHDYLNIEHVGEQEEIARMTNKGLYNRFITLFLFLRDVPPGGHTNFPRAGGLSAPKDDEECSVGLPVRGNAGQMVLMYNLDAAGAENELSLHAGCPPESGEKWLATKWIWNRRDPDT